MFSYNGAALCQNRVKYMMACGSIVRTLVRGDKMGGALSRNIHS